LLLKVVRRHLNPAMRTQVDSADFVQEGVAGGAGESGPEGEF